MNLYRLHIATYSDAKVIELRCYGGGGQYDTVNSLTLPPDTTDRQAIAELQVLRSNIREMVRMEAWRASRRAAGVRS